MDSRHIVYFKLPQFRLHTGPIQLRSIEIISQENQHLIREGNFQQQFGFNVWLGIIGTRIIGPIFEGPLTGPRYLGFLQNEIEKRLRLMREHFRRLALKFRLLIIQESYTNKWFYDTSMVLFEKNELCPKNHLDDFYLLIIQGVPFENQKLVSLPVTPEVNRK
ncbi:hypothetical protein NQ315_010960 [Exocentrus adspersus]|uniref:Uncharacterized protein n=1 Tax=Exocentrus adspersus TaxID=1586481 RepID=A0AAV8VGG4_9CUCU|nr:hypothetical protein NQ315_010960 [Exocentrus adspersus]